MAGVLDTLSHLGDLGGAASQVKTDLDQANTHIAQIASSVGNAERYIKIGMFGGLAIGGVALGLSLFRRR